MTSRTVRAIVLTHEEPETTGLSKHFLLEIVDCSDMHEPHTYAFEDITRSSSQGGYLIVFQPWLCTM